MRRPRLPAGAIASDVLAGVTLWAVFAAQAIAYSRLAHATVAAGLVTAVVGALIYAALGSSIRISIGPAGGIAAIVGAAVATVPSAQLPQALAWLTLLTGGALVIAGFLRASFLQRLFPTPVFVGYLAGTGVTIILGEARELAAHGGLAAAIGVAAAVAVLALKRLAPRVPGPFVVLLAATLASIAFGLAARGVPVIGATLGHFGVPRVPGFDGPLVRALVGPAIGLAMIVYVDALANANMLMQPGDRDVRPRREFFALGAVNVLCGAGGGFVAGTSSSRSIVGIRAGEKTRLAPAVAGVLLLLTGLSVVKFLTPMPLAALAGVVLVAAVDLIDHRRLREMWRLRRPDFLIAAATGVGVIAVGMVRGIVLGIVVALAEALRRASHPDRLVVTRQPGHVYEPFSPDAVARAHDVLIYRFGAGLYFGNADVFLDDMRAIARAAPADLHTVMLNADALGVPDASARDALHAAQRELADHHLRFVVGNARARLRAALAKVGDLVVVDEAAFIRALRTVRN
jgi:SulP family sulfate permease